MQPEEARARLVSGVASLATREAVLRGVSLVSSVILARLLSPREFGLFGIAVVAVTLVRSWGQLGFGSAFIRRRDDVSDAEFGALFTLQCVWGSALGLGLAAAAPLVASIYGEPDLVWLVRALSLSILLGALRSVPTVILERQLEYRQVAYSDVAAQITQSVVAVAGALAGWGVWSLAGAVIASSCVGTAVLYWSTRWRPQLRFDWSPLRRSLRTGAVFQGQGLLHIVKDTMAPAFGGAVYGPAAAGYLAWAQQLASLPLQLTNLVSRVSYPVLVNLQDDPAAATNTLHMTLSWTARLSFPFFAVIMGLAPELTRLVYGEKWLPALPALYLYLPNMVLGLASGVVLPALYSSDRVNEALRISGVWTALVWAGAGMFYVLGAPFQGIAAAHSLGTAIALVLILRAVPGAGPLAVMRSIAGPSLSGLLIAAALKLVTAAWLPGWAALASLTLLGASVGLAVNLMDERATVIHHVKAGLGMRSQSPDPAADREGASPPRGGVDGA